MQQLWAVSRQPNCYLIVAMSCTIFCLDPPAFIPLHKSVFAFSLCLASNVNISMFVSLFRIFIPWFVLLLNSGKQTNNNLERKYPYLATIPFC